MELQKRCIAKSEYIGMFLKIKHVHFIGIGGIGMSGLAELLHNLGLSVSGSDAAESENTLYLRRRNIGITIGHHPENIRPLLAEAGCSVVVYSSAIRPDNPELAAARSSKIPLIPRAEILAELMRLKHGIAIAGTHGKTTTTSMIATVLASAGLDPTIVIGGRLAGLAGGSQECQGSQERHGNQRNQGDNRENSQGDAPHINARLGEGDFLVAEADESDGSFLKLRPTIAVVTTVEAEHMEYYGSLEKVKAAFLDFINKVPFYGAAVLCLDEENIRALVPGIRKRFISYGLQIGDGFQPAASSGEGPRLLPDLTAACIEAAGLQSSFEVLWMGRTMGKIVLNVPGIHNIANSLAAIAVGLDLDISFDTIQRALASFRGADRRFQVKAHVQGTYVIDDYGHHPTEIRATLAAARSVLAAGSVTATGSDGMTAAGVGMTAAEDGMTAAGDRMMAAGDRTTAAGAGSSSQKDSQARRLIVIFQPHRYTRTRDLLTDFYTAFSHSDILIITDIYAAGEEPIEGIHSQLMADGIRRHGHGCVHYIPNRDDIPCLLMEIARPGDMILTLGAGDIWKISQKIVTMVKEKFT
ncbi:MAG: UDP-N-acetylmuramate--L-alanine ligase [bacterium]